MLQLQSPSRSVCAKAVRALGSAAIVAGLLGCGPKAGVQNESVSVTSERFASVPRQSARMFISGHSLVDQPFPAYLDQIAASLQTPIEWNRQYIVGSSIARRSRGESPTDPQWRGYREGFNRAGEGLDVVQEFARPATVSGPYDVLLITEQHGLLGTLMWNDTVRHLRDFHERFIAGNAAGSTYFYEPWLDMPSKSEPQRWIDYERSASPIWQCIATRVNTSLQHEGRADRIVTIPAGLALADLVDRAIGPGVEGVTRSSTDETVDAIFSDTVHLRPLGAYFVALVAYASVFQRDPTGAWHPPEVSATQAATLQQIVREFVTAYYERYRPLTLAECRERLDSGFIGDYWAYVRDTLLRRDQGFAQRYWQWLQMSMESRRVLGREDHRNPFFFDPMTDEQFWRTDEPGRR